MIGNDRGLRAGNIIGVRVLWQVVVVLAPRKLGVAAACLVCFAVLGVNLGVSQGDESPSTGNAGKGIGISVPWAIGGERIERDGSRRWFPGEWPTVPVSVVRVWDSRTAWLNIEPSRGVFDFRRLDAYVAKAESRGASVLLVLGGTPRWTAHQVRVTDAPWMGPGSASPPASFDDWSRFVSAVASRYSGRIAAYEVWNEPNSKTFWSGTPGQYGLLVQVASSAIRAADPDAQVLASGFMVGDQSGVEQLAPWVAALGSSGAAVDAVSLHWYPRAGSEPMAVRGAVRAFRSLLGGQGLGGAPIAVTEMNVRGGSGLPAAAQRRWVVTLQRELEFLGVAPIVWYAWTDLGPPNLIQFQPGSPGAQALRDLMERDLSDSSRRLAGARPS